jgi:DNA-directed RNA polymerase I, II, and III subunit RPABC5
MIIPIRCYTCGKVVADKWNTYITLLQEEYIKQFNQDNTNTDELSEYQSNVNPGFKKKILDDMGLYRYCCRSMILTNVDMCDKI